MPGNLTSPTDFPAIPSGRDEAISLAQDRNPSVIAAIFDLESAKHFIRVEAADLLPTVEAIWARAVRTTAPQLGDTLARGAAAHARALDRLLANAAVAAARASHDDGKAARRRERRAQLASLATYRQEHLMECPHCGVAVVIAKLREHQERACVNQERPCKNWTQGCKETVRPLTATWHECADHLLRPRSCLSLPGPCAARAAYVAVDEADLEAPWTAEFWIRRAPVEQPGGLLEGLARKAFRADALRRRLDDAVLASQGKAQEIERELAAFFAQPDALAVGKVSEDPHKAFPGDRPSLSLLFDAVTPRSMGLLLALYEHRVAVQGWVWGINSFDQWGVQLGKVLAKEVGKGLVAKSTQGFNASTAALIGAYLEQ